MKQSKIDSAMETVCNTAVGYVVAYITYHFVSIAWGLNTSAVDNFWITNIFTVMSLLRQYILRRMFNGRSVWQEIKYLLRHRRFSSGGILHVDIETYSRAGLPLGREIVVKPGDTLYAVVEGGAPLKKGADGFAIPRTGVEVREGDTIKIDVSDTLKAAMDPKYRTWSRPAKDMTSDELADVRAEVLDEWDRIANDPEFEGHGGSPFERYEERVCELETELRKRGFKL